MKKPIVFLILLLFFSSMIHAHIILDKSISKLDDFVLGYYHDENQSIDIETISKMNFTNKLDNKFSLGYIKGDSWFKLSIDNQSNKRKFVLYLSEPFFNEVVFYTPKANIWERQISGLSIYRKYQNKIDINPRFVFEIEAGTRNTFYIQIHTKPKETMVNFGEFSIFTQERFGVQDIFSDIILYSFYFGTMAIIVFFNFFLFWNTRKMLYLYYTLYVFFNGIYIFSYSGFSYYAGLENWNNTLNLSVPLLVYFFVLFSINFLKTAIYTPKIDKFLRFFTKLLILFFIPLIIIDYDPWFDITVQIITPLVPILILTSLIIFFRGYKKIKYYSFATSLYMLSMMLLSLMTQGVLENSDFNHYAFVYSSYIEILFFSFLLTNTFHKNQKELIEIKEQQHQKLEKGIEEKTHQISKLLKDKELLLKELHHRVKNNFQMVISLIWLQSKKEKNKELFSDLINRIRAISLVHVG